jgi:fused signal recognition particle receptor
MFGKLKKAFSGIFSKKEEKPVKKEKKAKAPAKKTTTLKKLPKTTSKKVTDKTSKLKIEKLEKKAKELEKKVEVHEAPEIEPVEKGFFSKLVSKITTAELTATQFEDFFDELELTLLENNVALEAVDKMKQSLMEDLVGKRFKSSEAETKVTESLKEAISTLLKEPPNLIEAIKNHEGPYVIIFFGINGTGKTTSIAKLTHLLKKNKISTILAPADTFRAAAIEQLQTHAKALDVPIVNSEYEADPSSIAFDAIAKAKKENIQVVLIDTAGRMYNKANLMKEMEKIIRVSKPNLKIFVGESITGNDAIDQARSFNETAGIDGIILSKADIDEKAGTILSVSHATKAPIYFLGTGQEYKDLTPFSKSEVFKNLGLE